MEIRNLERIIPPRGSDMPLPPAAGRPELVQTHLPVPVHFALWLLLSSGVVRGLTRLSRRRGRRVKPCRGDAYCARPGRYRDRPAACPARCRGAGAARSAAATRKVLNGVDVDFAES